MMFRKGKDAPCAPWWAMLAVLSMMMFAACAAPTAPGGTQAGATQGQDVAAATEPIQIGSKDFTEAILVAELYAQVQLGCHTDRS
jgi:glycine betaine/choline ABC-type transport system substrate-binding protein